jgi:hypothetical protein
VVEVEGQCSTQVEPSPHQDLQASPPQDNRQQTEDPPQGDQGQGQDQSLRCGDTPSDVQGQAQDDQGQAQEQAHIERQDGSQDGDENEEELPPRDTLEEAKLRRMEKRLARLVQRGHILDNVYGSVTKGVSTRKQLTNFSTHQAFFSSIEPQKV